MKVEMVLNRTKYINIYNKYIYKLFYLWLLNGHWSAPLWTNHRPALDCLIAPVSQAVELGHAHWITWCYFKDSEWIWDSSDPTTQEKNPAAVLWIFSWMFPLMFSRLSVFLDFQQAVELQRFIHDRTADLGQDLSSDHKTICCTK